MRQLHPAEIDKWLNGLAAMDKANEVIGLAIATTFGIPKSLLDVGSGDGALVNMMRRIGVEAKGVDILPRPQWAWLIQHDLTEPLHLSQQFDVVTCIETAEHIGDKVADVLCDSIARHIAPSGTLIFTAAMPGQQGDGHVNCVLGDTEVQASGIGAVTRRLYEGDVIRLTLESGHKLTVTPNHMILTPEGWKAAADLAEGCDVLSRFDTERVPFGVMPNHHHRPSKIEEIFGAFGEVPHARRISMPTTAEDFHGDGMDGEVDIVWTDGKLTNGENVLRVQKLHKSLIEWGNANTSPLIGESALGFDLHGIHHAPPGFKGGTTQRLAFVGAQFGYTQPIARQDGANRHAIAFEDTSDGAISQPGLFGETPSRFARLIPMGKHMRIDIGAQRLSTPTDAYAQSDHALAGGAVIDMRFDSKGAQALPVFVSLDKVAQIHRSKFSGHVYNLSTADGWYYANDIITHNCQPAEYWRSRFNGRGLQYRADLTWRLALAWSVAHHPLHWLEANLQVFTR